MSRTPTTMALAVSAALLAACAPGPGGPGAFAPAPGPAFATRDTPPDDDTQGCWASFATPAVIETVTEQALVQPAETAADGTVLQPAVFRTETRQKIVSDRREAWVETPCPADLTPEFVASLQRALKARAIYSGEITGQMDAPTRAAVRALQAPQGLDTGILSLGAARQLGLAVDPRFAAD